MFMYLAAAAADARSIRHNISQAGGRVRRGEQDGGRRSARRPTAYAIGAVRLAR